MKKFYLLVISALVFPCALHAQRILTLDECRDLALRNNKSLAMSRSERDKAMYTRMAAETNYLPKVQALAGYVHIGREISILNKDQKNRLNNLGTSFAEHISAPLQSQQAQALLAANPDLMPLVQQLQGGIAQVGGALNGYGARIVDAFRTDTRDIVAGALLLTQPLYMGGKIRAYDNITHYSERLADLKYTADQSEIILEVDRAYWQVVSLSNKLQLARNFHNTLQKLDNDVQKMIAEGVATKANELQVAVKLNEAEMLVTKVEDGLTLSRMLLAQTCGMNDSIDTIAFTLKDEYLSDIAVDTTFTVSNSAEAFARRPELAQLETAVNIYKEKAKIEKAAYLPQIAFVGGVMVSNPNGFNGFQNKFAGTWSVGFTFKMPVWSWHEGRYKVRAAEAEAAMAAYRAEEVREKIGLQVAQETFRVNEAIKKLRLTRKSLEKAEENLRIANLGYKEGVIVLSDVLQAQTAWLQANSEKIDAQVDVMLTRSMLTKAMGNTVLPAEPERKTKTVAPSFLKKIIR